MTTAAPFKITYTSSNTDMTLFHTLFDEALAKVRGGAGRRSLVINGKTVKGKGKKPLSPLSPIDGAPLGVFETASKAQIDEAVKAARAAQKAWGATPWKERLAVLRKAAAVIRDRKWEIGAVMALEVGKNRMEAMGDAEESADLLDYYAQTFEDNHGYARALGKLLPNERTASVLRPYGVFVCIAPFNFPMALSAGMSGAALIAGNSVVYKPAPATPWTGLLLAQCYAQAGLPAGLFNYVPADLAEVGDHFWRRDDVDGIVFTGSRDVGLRLVKEFPSKFPRPVLMEGGGKNAAYVSDTADLDMAAQGVMKSAFGLQGQKCSACSRVYVHHKVADKFIAKLLEKTAAIKIGDPTEKDNWLGPVINEASVKRYEDAVKASKKSGKVLAGGKKLPRKGFFVEPCVAELPLSHELFRKELFVPFVAVGRVKGLDEAIAESNKADYGLTAGIFSGKLDEIEKFFNEIEAGVCYANRPTGATTGAWPGVQSFCGWKGSGSTGKGGCGPYYVSQFMREQSRTFME